MEEVEGQKAELATEQPSLPEQVEATPTPTPTQPTEEQALPKVEDSKPAPKKGHRPSLNRGPLTDKEACPDCQKVVSKHSLIYNRHKCEAKSKKASEIVVADIGSEPKAKPAAQPKAKATPASLQTQVQAAPAHDVGYDENFIQQYLMMDPSRSQQQVSRWLTWLREQDKEQKANRFKSLLAGKL